MASSGDRRARSADARPTQKRQYIYTAAAEQEKLQGNLNSLLIGQAQRHLLSEKEKFLKNEREKDVPDMDEDFPAMDGGVGDFGEAYNVRAECFRAARDGFREAVKRGDANAGSFKLERVRAEHDMETEDYSKVLDLLQPGKLNMTKALYRINGRVSFEGENSREAERVGGGGGKRRRK